MPRGSRKIAKHKIAADPKFGSELVGKLINLVMESGKKSIAESIVYGAFAIIKEKTNEEPVKFFEKAMETIRPQVEVRSRRVGGANYQVPMPVSTARQNALAFRWILEAARGRKGMPMANKLATEIMDAANGIGAAVKKKEEVHRMADANKAFAHFARR